MLKDSQGHAISVPTVMEINFVLYQFARAIQKT